MLEALGLVDTCWVTLVVERMLTDQQQLRGLVYKSCVGKYTTCYAKIGFYKKKYLQNSIYNCKKMNPLFKMLHWCFCLMCHRHSSTFPCCRSAVNCERTMNKSHGSFRYYVKVSGTTLSGMETECCSSCCQDESV